MADAIPSHYCAYPIVQANVQSSVQSSITFTLLFYYHAAVMRLEATIEKSIIEPFILGKHTFFVKRDDLIDPLLSGNKYRKLHSLVQTPADRYNKIYSYGGAQSNAMLSIAALCQRKGWAFDYTVKTLPHRIKENPTGNLQLALQLGMHLHEVNHDTYAKAVRSLHDQADDKALFVPQGGADPIAQAGIQQLGCEIQQWQQKMQGHGLNPRGIKNLHIVTPSGTGTTAFYLAHALPEYTVLTTPIVGDAKYLMQQMGMLGMMPENLHILQNSKKHHFAKPYPELLAMYEALRDAGITFDLIYGALMWHTLLQHLHTIEGTILYVHSGGLLGNASMLDRYAHGLKS